MTPTAYPLAWPPQFPRAKHGMRERGAFKTTLHVALHNVQRSLGLFSKDSGKKLDGLVISSNVTLGVNNPQDPGVAVYFAWDGLSICIPVDRYQSVESNLQAIHHVIEARRVELRHGTLALVRATFQGFAALPAPRSKDWGQVLGFPDGAAITREDVEGAYRRLAKERHPDAGGSEAMMAELNGAIADARKAFPG